MRTSANGHSLSKPAARRRGRPRKDASAHLATKEKLIRCGIELLTEKGYACTGIDELLKKVGVPKGSFYHYFASKDDFGRAVIEGYAQYFANKLDRCLLNEARAPLDRLQDFISEGKQGMQRFAFRRGCLIGNMGQELATTQDGFREPLELVFLDWQRRVQQCLEAAKQSGTIDRSADCEKLAAFFWIGWEGAVLRAKLVRSITPIELFADMFFASISADLKYPPSRPTIEDRSLQ